MERLECDEETRGLRFLPEPFTEDINTCPLCTYGIYPGQPTIDVDTPGVKAHDVCVAGRGF